MTTISIATQDDISAQIQVHRGAIDQTTITIQPPAKVMQKVQVMLLALGVNVQVESMFRYRCVRPRREGNTMGQSEADVELELDGGDVLVSAGSAPRCEDVELQAEDPQTPTQNHPQLPESSPPLATAATTQCSLYGSSASDDPGGEVRFSIELTRLSGLSDTYSLDIRRLKGHLRSYKFIYDTLRDRAELNR